MHLSLAHTFKGYWVCVWGICVCTWIHMHSINKEAFKVWTKTIFIDGQTWKIIGAMVLGKHEQVAGLSFSKQNRGWDRTQTPNKFKWVASLVSYRWVMFHGIMLNYGFCKTIHLEKRIMQPPVKEVMWVLFPSSYIAKKAAPIHIIAHKSRKIG